ncbi:uncharacterized protein LOC131035794 [Cryptomeria japonica]|uniref:uncharacterized protein LOC131035794 n=1 Tax=Cryptomeria japonica TaxID=3369 RepID=UPI0027DA3716|nr:uncharacterized protein LOC131035794 [Cryptomeria japonica]
MRRSEKVTENSQAKIDRGCNKEKLEEKDDYEKSRSHKETGGRNKHKFSEKRASGNQRNLVNLRHTIYSTIMSSVDFEEAGHKLLRIKLESGQEVELCIMLLECCSQERTYRRYYGLLGKRFYMINKVYQEFFEKCFVQQYSMVHRLETNKLRNAANFFAHLLATDALPWHCLAYKRLTEEDTTSSFRIFIKILFQELAEQLGIFLLNKRLNDPTMQEYFDSIFPKDNPKNSWFAINFFTSIGLGDIGDITESLSEYLKNMPRLIMQQQKSIPEFDESSWERSSGGAPVAAEWQGGGVVADRKIGPDNGGARHLSGGGQGEGRKWRAIQAGGGRQSQAKQLAVQVGSGRRGACSGQRGRIAATAGGRNKGGGRRACSGPDNAQYNH